ncbi:phage major capsid protein [Salininema proteolyticum]|uniref:Major capsid protein n=1 Tax=Salininema proteolyticum TaxID=1607685 RepID=A0ABV8TZ06_9ACTN
MSYTPHDVVKPEKVAATAAVLLEQQLVLPAVFRREGIEQYKGSEGDAITVTVEGVLPYRTYGWRNDRSTELQFDTYRERKIAVTFGDDVYSAVKLTDEQAEFDMTGWAKLSRKQTEALGRGLERKAVDYVRKTPFAVTLGVATENLKSGLIRARAAMRQLQVPDGPRTILCGVNWEAALLEDERLNLASNVGEAEAVSSLREATLGRRYGFNFVVAPELDPDTAIAMVDSAYIFATGAPYVPQSVPFGATASHNGIALRWIRDYDSSRVMDRSIFNTYQSFSYVDDILIGVDDATGQAFVGEHEHFIRAIELRLDGTDSLPDGANGRPDRKRSAEADDELAAITGLGTRADSAGPQAVSVQSAGAKETADGKSTAGKSRGRRAAS